MAITNDITHSDLVCSLYARKRFNFNLNKNTAVIIIIYFFQLLSNTVQNGAVEKGILGFLLNDIKAELNRGFREVCSFYDFQRVI